MYFMELRYEDQISRVAVRKIR